MQWRVATNEYGTTHNTSLGISPKAAPNLCTGSLHDESKPISLKKSDQDLLADVIDREYVRQIVPICFNTMRTRLSTIASRINSCSCALPSTSVGSYV